MHAQAHDKKGEMECTLECQNVYETICERFVTEEEFDHVANVAVAPAVEINPNVVVAVAPAVENVVVEPDVIVAVDPDVNVVVDPDVNVGVDPDVNVAVAPAVAVDPDVNVAVADLDADRNAPPDFDTVEADAEAHEVIGNPGPVMVIEPASIIEDKSFNKVSFF
jgi:hypothetical protein